MNASSADADSIATTRFQAGLKLIETALAATDLDKLARGAFISDTGQLSKVRSGQLGAKLREIVGMLYAADLKVVGADKVCVDRARYEAMVTMATAAMSDEQTVRRLTWDE